MKTDLLISLFPIVFLLIDSLFSRERAMSKKYSLQLRHFALIGLIAYFFLFTVSAYSELRRPRFWESTGNNATIPDASYAPGIISDLSKSLKGSIPGTQTFFELHHYPDRGVWHMLNRLTVTSWAATAIKLVESSGTRQDSIIDAIILSVTPRILFPDKPQIVWGREVAVKLGQASTVESARTATGLTMFGFLYWWGGYTTMILMSFLSGAGFAFITYLFLRDWNINPISTLVLMALVYNGLHWKESDVLGGFPFYLYMMIVFFPLSRFFTAKHKRMSVRSPSGKIHIHNRNRDKIGAYV